MQRKALVFSKLCGEMQLNLRICMYILLYLEHSLLSPRDGGFTYLSEQLCSLGVAESLKKLRWPTHQS